jgi:hypothetical protein
MSLILFRMSRECASSHRSRCAPLAFPLPSRFPPRILLLTLSSGAPLTACCRRSLRAPSDLSMNRLTALPVGGFTRITKLTSLSLYDNQLLSLQAGQFDKLSQLTTLYLQSNKIGSLPSGAFGTLPSLSTLYVTKRAPLLFPLCSAPLTRASLRIDYPRCRLLFLAHTLSNVILCIHPALAALAR